MLFPEITSIVANNPGLGGDCSSGHFQVGLEVSFFCVEHFISQASLPLYGFFVDTLVLASLQGVFFGYFSVLCRSCLHIENPTKKPSEGLLLYGLAR